MMQLFPDSVLWTRGSNNSGFLNAFGDHIFRITYDKALLCLSSQVYFVHPSTELFGQGKE